MAEDVDRGAPAEVGDIVHVPGTRIHGEVVEIVARRGGGEACRIRVRGLGGGTSTQPRDLVRIAHGGAARRAC